MSVLFNVLGGYVCLCYGMLGVSNGTFKTRVVCWL